MVEGWGYITHSKGFREDLSSSPILSTFPAKAISRVPPPSNLRLMECIVHPLVITVYIRYIVDRLPILESQPRYQTTEAYALNFCWQPRRSVDMSLQMFRDRSRLKIAREKIEFGG